MKNILFYCKDFYPMHNGYANAYKNLISKLCLSNKYKITVVTTTKLSSEEELEFKNLNIIRISSLSTIKYLRYVINAKKIAKVLNEQFKSNDALFLETCDEPLIFNFLEEKVLKRTIVRYHSTSDTEYTQFFPGFNNKLNKLLQKTIVSNKINNFCSTNQYHLEFVKKHFLSANEYKISKKKFFEVPNTLSSNVESNIDNNLNKKNKIFILGRMNKEGFYQKGFDDFLDAMRNIKKEQINNYSFTILGDGDLFEYVKNQISRLDIVDNIELFKTMPHEDVLLNLKESRAVILPSRFEGHSMFALEAIGHGCIGVFSDAGALKDIIINNEFTFKAQDSYELMNKILQLVQLNPNELEYFSEKSITSYVERYSSDKVLDMFDYCINTVVTNE